jgi:hypothetical protein
MYVIYTKMPKSYSCKECDYNTIVCSNFSKHKKTSKHLLNLKTKVETTVKPVNNSECEYCNLTVSTKYHLKRHYKICNVKNCQEDSKDKLIKELIKEKDILIKEKEEILFVKNEIETEYRQLVRNVGAYLKNIQPLDQTIKQK